MQSFFVQYTPQARADMEDVYKYIVDELHAPMTAARYFNGLLDKITSLSRLGDIFSESTSDWVQRNYGPGARTIVYKKMTVIYRVIDNIVLIRRVIASSRIK